jgi:hypothetical protein
MPFQGIDNHGGVVTASDSTFFGNGVGVNGSSGATTVLRSTFEGELGSLTGSVSVAGSVLGPDSIQNGNGTITDLGDNLATDDTCDLTQPTSRQDVSDLDLDASPSDHGGPVPTIAIAPDSPAVDFIPNGATYGDPGVALCGPGMTDERGVTRPQGGACDAGSLELVGTSVQIRAPLTARPHTAVPLEAAVTASDAGIPGIPALAGTVTFRSGTRVLCAAVPISDLGAASCAGATLAPGERVLTATFEPAAGTTYAGSTSAAPHVVVGTRPAFTSPHTARFVAGRAHTFRVRASGSPRARITLASGSLPSGLHFHAGTGTAEITGTARRSALGAHHVTVEAHNLRGTTHQRLRIVVARP